VVAEVITDLGVFRPEGEGFGVVELAEGVALADVRAPTGAPVRG
jgi:acyl CoA:acetate/3-ketoacid CoA transferase beta subunit